MRNFINQRLSYIAKNYDELKEELAEFKKTYQTILENERKEYERRIFESELKD